MCDSLGRCAAPASLLCGCHSCDSQRWARPHWPTQSLVLRQASERQMRLTRPSYEQVTTDYAPGYTKLSVSHNSRFNADSADAAAATMAPRVGSSVSRSRITVPPAPVVSWYGSLAIASSVSKPAASRSSPQIVKLWPHSAWASSAMKKSSPSWIRAT
mmetsp:Transcript_18385/g.59165  ORF Transcript_18385/g.59165 Transcript_18385/m.59165 type:complete len:158 (+) Transcript_18385:70-543(+)